MNRIVRGALSTLGVALLVTACAVRLGGPKPEVYETVALSAAPGSSAADVGARLRAADTDIAFIVADQDSAWFAGVAAAAELELSGPGHAGVRGMAFLTDLELLGDTSLVLNVAGGGQVHMHDALYKIDKNRNIDLMLVRFDAPDIRLAVTTLLGYFATDVGASVPLLLGIDESRAQLADSAAILMRAYLTDARECRSATQLAGVAAPVRLLFGPTALASCDVARLLTGAPPAVAARVTIGR